MKMVISHLKTMPFQGTLFIFFKLETDTARSSVPHYSCKRSVTSLFRGDRMAFSGSIKARERPYMQKKRKKNRGKVIEQKERRKTQKTEKKQSKDRKTKEHKFTERRREKGGATQRQELALLLSSSLQKKKNSKSVKKKYRRKGLGRNRTRESLGLANPDSRTLTIIVFFQSRGIRKHRPKAFFREESEQGREYRNQEDNTKNWGRRSNQGERE